MSTLKQPVISVDEVQKTLDALQSASQDLSTPLFMLMLIDEALINPDLPHYKDARTYFLAKILTDIIQEQFYRYMQMYNLTLPETFFENWHSLDLTPLFDGIITASNPIFQGWSILFFRYVIVDIGINIDTLSSLLAMADRTLRRHQRKAMTQLTELLMQKEWAVRKKQRRRRLYMALPSTIAVPLFGREAQFEQLCGYLTGEASRHVFVTGAPNIGKTALVQEAIRYLIDQDRLDYVIWLSAPPSVDFVRMTLIDHLTPSQTRITIAETVQLYSVALILDDISSLDDQALCALLADMGQSAVVLINRGYRALASPHVHLPLMEIVERDCQRLVAHVMQGKYAADDAYIEAISPMVWERVGGNPGKVIVLARNAEMLLEDEPLDDVYQPYEHDFDNASVNLRRAWLVFLLFPAQDVELRVLQALFADVIDAQTINTLIRQHWIERVSAEMGLVRLPQVARQFLEMRIDQDATTQTHLMVLFQAIETQIAAQNLDVLMPLEYILRNQGLGVSADRARYWLQQSWRLALDHGYAARWLYLIQTLSADQDFELQLAEAVCLRRVGHLAQAQDKLLQIIQAAGAIGQFTVQAWAQLEYAILLRMTGHYGIADQSLRRALDTAKRYQMQDLEALIVLEMAQIAVDERNADKALAYLHEDKLTPRGTVLYAEALLLKHEYQEAYARVQHLLNTQTQGRSRQARLHVLLGRIAQAMQNIELAKTHYQYALTAFELEEDIFSLARTHTNFASILFETDFALAGEMLRYAEDLQLRLHDAAGLIITQHNLMIHQRAAASGYGSEDSSD